MISEEWRDSVFSKNFHKSVIDEDIRCHKINRRELKT
jgi:hypothetical protein